SLAPGYFVTPRTHWSPRSTPVTTPPPTSSRLIFSYLKTSRFELSFYLTLNTRASFKEDHSVHELTRRGIYRAWLQSATAELIYRLPRQRSRRRPLAGNPGTIFHFELNLTNSIVR